MKPSSSSEAVARSSRPLVTIITPSFNQGQFIEATIESVLAQDYPNIEYLVIDGASTDDTLEVLGRYDGRLRWRSEPDDGQSDAIRHGFAEGSGEILAWLNADDLYAPGAVSMAVSALETSPDASFVYGRADYIDREGRPSGGQIHRAWDFDQLLNVRNFVPQAATFFRRAAYEAVGGLSVDLHYVMDYDLWLRLGRLGGAIAINQRMALVRMYPETKTASGGLARVDEMGRMIARHGRRRLPTGHHWDAVRANVLASGAAWRSDDPAQAMRFGVRALSYLGHPTALGQGARFAARRARSLFIRARP